MTSRADALDPPLQVLLDEITAHTRALVPAARLQGTEDLVASLQASGLVDRILPVGASAPAFALPSTTGRLVRSSDLLALGSLVLKFFRGRWDPYDITELETWESLQPELRSRRTLIVGISPQLSRQNAFTVEHHHLTFPLLTDASCQVAAQFALAYTVPTPSQTHYRSMLVNLPFLNGEDSWQLPLPATYVLDTTGKVLFAQAFADHRKRPDPASVLRALPPVLKG